MHEIDDDLSRPDHRRNPSILRVAVRDDEAVAGLEDVLDSIDEKVHHMWHCAVDEPTVRADQPRKLDVRIEDAHLLALADEGLDKGHVRTLPQVVGVRLEAESKKSDCPLARVQNHLKSEVDLLAVRLVQVFDEWHGNVTAAGEGSDRLQVLG